jgi:hypothetical protein
MRLQRHASAMWKAEDEVVLQSTRIAAMNALAVNAQTPDDTRLWSPSLVDAVATGMPKQDPVAQLLAEQKRDGAMLRLVMCAGAAVLILVVGAGVLV